MQSRVPSFLGAVCAVLISLPRSGTAQTTSATFGDVVRLGGTPSDIVLDESRGRLYLVQASSNRVAIYDYNAQAIIGTIAVGSNPLAAAMAMDNSVLYVTNNGSSSLSVIDLNSTSVLQTIPLPAKPEGVEVGIDGRAVIATQGNGTGNLSNTLLAFDRTQPSGQQMIAVPFPPPPSTPTGIPAPQVRAVTTFRSKLLRTPDGTLIVGVNISGNFAYLYVYEPNSATVLRSRSVGGQSSVLAMSPDGTKFMAGAALYDINTLAVIAQQRSENAPFAIGTFNTNQQVGGSSFSPDGTSIYSAFNVAPFVQPATRPQASTLLISDSRHLRVNLGIKLPESIVAKMVQTSDGSQAWGLSESGMIHLPLAHLYDYPILMPERTNVFLAQDPCHNGIATASLKINNLGKGKLTFSVPDTGNALMSQAASGVAPSSITFTMDPGRNGVVRQAGTNLYTGNATATGNAIAVTLRSVDAINIPPTILVYMNYRLQDQRGVIYPVAAAPNSTAQGLQDLVLDEKRGRLYISNAGYNRIEVFDTNARTFLAPMEAGQLPHQMAMGPDGDTLYVGNSGGESIQTIDLNSGMVTGTLQFPPYPRAGNTNPVAVSALAMGLSGLQFILQNGSQWEVVGSQATLRPPDSIAVNPGNTAQNIIPAPQTMMATSGGENILTLGGTGTAYLYDGMADAYTASAQLFNAPITGYYGPLGAASGGAFFLANGAVLSSTITQSVVVPIQRNVAAVAPIDQNTFLRITTPIRNAINQSPRDDVRTLLEIFDLQSGGESLVGPLAENPPQEVFGTGRANIPPRQMVVGSDGTVYAITLSGLSVIPLPQNGISPKPQLNPGARAIVNSNDGTPNFKPGAFITINGSNLASQATATQLPPPTVLGGSCVVFDNIAVPLLQTSGNQISAQLPGTAHAGANVVQVRSLANAQQSDPMVVTVQKP